MLSSPTMPRSLSSPDCPYQSKISNSSPALREEGGDQPLELVAAQQTEIERANGHRGVLLREDVS